MSIPFSGTFKRSAGVASAIGKQLKRVNLKPVKKITVTFDPFHENAIPTRDFLFHVSSPKVVLTNPNCVIKTDIVCDRREPSVKFFLTPAAADESKTQTVTLKSGNLSTLELLQLCNLHVSALAPKEEPVTVLKTKSEKKAGGAGGKGKK